MVRTCPVTTRIFVENHGKEPRGDGIWAFKIDNETLFFPGAKADYRDCKNAETGYSTCMYGQAKKEALEYARKKKFEGMIYVLP